MKKFLTPQALIGLFIVGLILAAAILAFLWTPHDPLKINFMMQAVGINAQIEVLEWATQLDRYNSGNYQMSSFTYSSRLDPALSYEQFSGAKAKQPRKVWDDPAAQKLIDQSFTEADPKKRQALFDQLHTMRTLCVSPRPASRHKPSESQFPPPAVMAPGETTTG